MRINVDSWTTGYRGDMVQLPLAQSLAADGRIDQRIIFCEHSPKREEMLALGLPSLTTPGTRHMPSIPNALSRIPKTRGALANWYHDDSRRIVHVAMWSPWDHFYLDVPGRKGAQLLLTVHDAQKHIGEENWFLTKLENNIINRCDHIAVLSDYAKDVLSQRIGRDRPIHVISPGLIMNTADPSPPKKAPRNRPMRFLFFGRIHAYKGLDILLDAWSLVKQSDAPPMQLSIVGSGDIAPYQAAIDRSVDVQVQHGWISDEQMQRVFDENDVNVMAYRETSASATALAGLWAGMPSIATPIAGLKDYFVAGHNAIVTDEISARAVAASLIKIAAEPHLYERLAQGANAHANAHSAQSVVNNWYGLYEDIWSSAAW